MPQLINVVGESFEYRPRAEWGARQTSVPVDSDGPEPKGYLHQEGGGFVSPLLTVDQEIRKMRDFQAFCMTKWSDIPYNQCVMPSGRAYEGRGWSAQSGATADENTESKAVVMLGNYDMVAPPLGMLNTATLMFIWGVERKDLALTPQILGHWENPDHWKATSCPGKNVDLNAFRLGFTKKLALLGGLPPDGYDMSHWQVEPRWAEVLYWLSMTHKAVEIKDGFPFVDPRLHDRWQVFRQRARYRGHWLRIRSDSAVEDQTDLYLRVVDELGGLQRGEYMIVDWEPLDPDGSGPRPNLPPVTPQMLGACLERLERRWGKRWMVYTYMFNPGFPEWRSANPDAPLQLAHYGVNGPQEAARFGAALHQFKVATAPGFPSEVMHTRVLRTSVLDRITNQSIVRPVPGGPSRKDPDVRHIVSENRPPALVGPNFVSQAENSDEAWSFTRNYGEADRLNDFEYDVTLAVHRRQP